MSKEYLEALEYLEHIKENDFNMIIATYPPLAAYNGVTKDEMFDKIEQELIKAQEQERENKLLKDQNKYLAEVVTEFQTIFTIIYEKNVDIKYLKDCKTVEEYNKYCDDITDEKPLTQNEFDLLKKIF